MQLERCRSCGGDLERIGNSYVCKFCGSKWVIDADQDVHVIDRANAWSALRDCDFEHAVELFENIIFKEPKNHEAYWGRALANAGIMYVTDFHENKKVPTCNSISESSFIDSRDVKRAIELAPTDIGESYRAQAEQIEAIRSEWVKKASREPAYDVFISYKDSDREHHIERTEDSYDAQELYMALTEAGYKVFFSRVSLRNKVSEHYEPYIYNAIKTAKVMIVYGEKPEYFNAVWIKNEWMRFRKCIEIGEKHPASLVVAYKGLDPADLPIGLRSRQCIDASSITFLEDLKKHIEKIIRDSKKAAAAVKVDEPAAVASPVKPRGKKGIIIAAIAAVLAVCIGLGFVVSNLAGGDGETTPVTPLDTEKPTFLPSVNETEEKTEEETPRDTDTQVEVETPRETDEVTSADTEEATSAATQAPTGEPTVEGTGAPAEKETDMPTVEATGAPTEKETDAPTVEGTDAPTEKDTNAPTVKVTDAPTEKETDAPSEIETENVSEETENDYGLEYTLNEDESSYSVSGIGECEATDIVIPKRYKGLPVTSISERAFEKCTDLISVTIGGNVESIGRYAFSYCEKVTEFVIPESVKVIESGAFGDCYALTEITIPYGVEVIGYFAFEYCTSLERVYIPSSVKEIRSLVLQGCSAFKGVEFDGTVDEWNSINKFSNWNDDIGDHVIYCSDENIVIEVETETEGAEETFEDIIYTGTGSMVINNISLPDGQFRITCTLISGGSNTTMYFYHGSTEEMIFNDYNPNTTDITMISGPISNASLVINGESNYDEPANWKVTIEKIVTNVTNDSYFENLAYSGTGSMVLHDITLPSGDYRLTCTLVSSGGNTTMYFYHSTQKELVLCDYSPNTTDITILTGPINNASLVINGESNYGEPASWKINIEKLN